MSGVDPGPNGTMMRTLFAGHSWAVAVKLAGNSSKSDNMTRRNAGYAGLLPLKISCTWKHLASASAIL